MPKRKSSKRRIARKLVWWEDEKGVFWETEIVGKPRKKDGLIELVWPAKTDRQKNDRSSFVDPAHPAITDRKLGETNPGFIIKSTDESEKNSDETYSEETETEIELTEKQKKKMEKEMKVRLMKERKKKQEKEREKKKMEKKKKERAKRAREKKRIERQKGDKKLKGRQGGQGGKRGKGRKGGKDGKGGKGGKGGNGGVKGSLPPPLQKITSMREVEQELKKTLQQDTLDAMEQVRLYLQIQQSTMPRKEPSPAGTHSSATLPYHFSTYT